MEPDHFERLLAKFEADPELGIASGTLFEVSRGSWRQRHLTGTTVVGGCRAYRWECLQAILPLEERVGWDGIDEFSANARGWKTRSFADIEFRHHRREGERDGGIWQARRNQGEAAWFVGYRPWYLTLRALWHMRREPASLGMVVGYAASGLRRHPRNADRLAREYLRGQQSWRNLRLRAFEARRPPPSLEGRDRHGPRSRPLREERRAERDEDEQQECHLDERERVIREHPDGVGRHGCRDRDKQPAPVGVVAFRFTPEPPDRASEEPKPTDEPDHPDLEQRPEPLVVDDVVLRGGAGRVDDAGRVALPEERLELPFLETRPQGPRGARFRSCLPATAAPQRARLRHERVLDRAERPREREVDRRRARGESPARGVASRAVSARETRLR